MISEIYGSESSVSITPFLHAPPRASRGGCVGHRPPSGLFQRVPPLPPTSTATSNALTSFNVGFSPHTPPRGATSLRDAHLRLNPTPLRPSRRPSSVARPALPPLTSPLSAPPVSPARGRAVGVLSKAEAIGGRPSPPPDPSLRDAGGRRSPLPLGASFFVFWRPRHPRDRRYATRGVPSGTPESSAEPGHRSARREDLPTSCNPRGGERSVSGSGPGAPHHLA